MLNINKTLILFDFLYLIILIYYMKLDLTLYLNLVVIIFKTYPK